MAYWPIYDGTGLIQRRGHSGGLIEDSFDLSAVSTSVVAFDEAAARARRRGSRWT